MKNLLKDLEPAGEQTTLFSQAGSRNYANHTHRLVSDLEKKMTDTSGRRCLEQYEKFSRPTLWGRTFSDLLIGMEGWYSTKCRLTWRLRGTKYNRLFFQLVPSTLPTEGIEFGLLLLKTPTKMDGEVTSGKANPVSGNSGTLAQEIMSNYEPTMHKLGLLPTPTTQETPHLQAELTENNRRKALNGNSHSLNIADLALRKMLPTPTAMDSSNATANMKSTQVKEGSMHSVTLVRAMVTGMLPTPRVKGHGNSHQRIEDSRIDDLTTMAKMGMLPTPLAGEYRDTGEKVKGNKYKQQNLTRTIANNSAEWGGKNSQLNPPFVLEMMGFPPDWTELPFLNGETKA
jgi:hypothetical protein